MNIPWELILSVGLKLIEWFVKDKLRRDELNKNFIKFIKSQNEEAYESLKLSDEYDEILQAIKNEEKGLKNDDSKGKV